MEFKVSWDTHLALMEFAYNNSYLASIEMAPFEALYGRKYRTPVCWDEVGERRLVGPELVQITSEKVKVVRDNLKKARDRQKSYADNRRRDLQFEIGDRVFLKISPWKGVLRFGRRGKLSPRFIEPYEIVIKMGLVAYRLKLPPWETSIFCFLYIIRDYSIFCIYGRLPMIGLWAERIGPSFWAGTKRLECWRKKV